MLQAIAADALATVTRAGLAYDFDATGVLREFAPNTLRTGVDLGLPASAGALIEAAGQNHIRNPRAEGAIATVGNGHLGSATPSGWNHINHASGLSLDLTPIAAFGMTGLRLRYYGTTNPSGSRAETLEFDIRSGAPVAAGTTWTGSVFYRLAAGALPPGAFLTTRFITINGSAGIVDNTSFPPSAPGFTLDATLRRTSHTFTATTGAVTGVFGTNIGSLPASTECDFTIEVFYPQLEPAAFASSPMLPPVGTIATSTRAPDAPRIVGAPVWTMFGAGPLRRNLAIYSQDFTNAAWGKGGATITANATTAPDGAATASKIVENTGTSSHNIRRTITPAVVVGQHTVSGYFKPAERQGFTFLVIDSNGNTASWNVDLVGGTIAVGGTSMASTARIDALPNGWFRVSITFTPPTGLNYFDIRLSNTTPPTGSVGASYTGDGTSGLFVWGVQLETGPTATAYIPTTAAPGEVADLLQGAIFVETVLPQVVPVGTNPLVVLDTGSAANRIEVRNIAGTTNLYAFAVIDNVAQVATAQAAFIAGVPFCLGLRWSSAGIAIAVDGGAIRPSAAPVPGGLAALRLGSNTAGTATINGRIRRVRALPYLPGDAEFQSRCIVGAP